MAGLESWSDDQLAEFYQELVEAERGQVPSQVHRAVRTELDRRIDKKAPDAGQGVEGNETHPQQGEDSVSIVDRQHDGTACVVCAADLSEPGVESVPAGHGPRGQLFMCVGAHQ